MDRSAISRKPPEKLLRLQCDLGVALSATSDQTEALNLILDATCRIEGIDCGGIYLFDKTTGDLNLMVHRGLPAEFVEKASHYSPDSPQVQLVMAGKPVYGLYAEIACTTDTVCHNEGLRALAVIPVQDKLKVVGALNLASHRHDQIPEDTRYAIESIASQIGGVFGRLAAEASLQESQKDFQRAHVELERRVDIRTAELAKANEKLTAEIAEHTRTEAKLRESEVNYRELFTAEPDAIIIADAENKTIVDANPSAVQLYGYSYEEMCGLSALALSAEPEKSLRHIEHIVRESFKMGPDGLAYRLHKRKDGTVFPVEIAWGIYSHKGHKLICAMIRDNSAREQAEEALKRSEQNFRLLIENQTDMVVKVDTQGRFLFVSPSYCEKFGKTEEELLGQTFLPLVHPDDRQAASTAMEDLHRPPYTAYV